MKDGKLDAIIDFGTCGVGDPACDRAIAWTMLTGKDVALRPAPRGLKRSGRRTQGNALQAVVVSHPPG